MSIMLTNENISSFVGDVLPLRLTGVDDRRAEVRWSVSGDAVTLRDFSDDPEYGFTTGVLLSLVKVGEATVKAEYDGKIYTASVSVRDMKHYESSPEMRYFFGDMHDHTSMNHKRLEFATHNYGDVADYVKYQREDGRLDFAVISDHAGVTNDHDFYRGFELATEGGNNDGVIIFAGAESEITYTERDRFDILHRLSGEIVTINSAGYSNTKSWDDFYRDMRYTPDAVAIFAHPHVVGFSTNGIWNFNFAVNNTPRMLEIARGMEMGNGADREENLIHEYAYHTALDAGFRLSTTCGSDSHGGRWGYDIMPGKTVIMAPEKSRETFLDALRSNRFYATESGNVKLAYSVNGKYAPCDLDNSSSYEFRVNISSFSPDESTVPTLLEVISDYGKPVYTTVIDSEGEISFAISSDTARYFYLRLIDREGRKTWSPPVFTGRAYDENKSIDLSPIDMSTVIASVDGERVDRVINGDPFDSYMTKGPSESILLDLGKVRSVSAVGYYPHIVLRGKDNGPDWTTSMESKHILAEYSVEYSVNGEKFIECASGRAGTLGAENIISFERVEARYIRFNAISSIGSASLRENYRDTPVKIANLSLFS